MWTLSCKFLEEALGYVETCFAVEERVAQQQDGGPSLGVSRGAMANASVIRAEKVFGGEAE